MRLRTRRYPFPPGGWRLRQSSRAGRHRGSCPLSGGWRLPRCPRPDTRRQLSLWSTACLATPLFLLGHLTSAFFTRHRRRRPRGRWFPKEGRPGARADSAPGERFSVARCRLLHHTAVSFASSDIRDFRTDATPPAVADDPHTSAHSHADDGDAVAARSARGAAIPPPKKRRSSCGPAHEARRKAFYASKKARTTSAPSTWVGAGIKKADGRGV